MTHIGMTFPRYFFVFVTGEILWFASGSNTRPFTLPLSNRATRSYHQQLFTITLPGYIFITVIDRVKLFIFLFLCVLRASLPTCDVYNITFRPLNIFTDFFDICHKQMLIYNYIIFVQLSVKERVKYKQCLNSLQTALVDVVCWIMYCWASFIWHNRTHVNLTGRYYIMD